MSKDPRSTDNPKGSKKSAGTKEMEGKGKPLISEAFSTLEGVVVAKGADAGIAGLQVFLRAEDAADGPRTSAALTDKDGRFVIRYRGSAHSIEISTADATHSVVRRIPPVQKDRLVVKLKAKDLSRLLPRRDVELKEREDLWEREATIRREVAHWRGLKAIERMQRRREFGAKIASQLRLSSVSEEVRKADKSYVEAEMSAKDQLARLLEVGRQGVAEAIPKKRAVMLDEGRIAELEKASARGGKAPLEKVLEIGVGPTIAAADERANEVLVQLRERVTITPKPGLDTDPAEDDSDPPGPAPEDDDESSAAKFVREALQRMQERDSGKDPLRGDGSDQDTLQAEIDSVKMAGGPADVTSYHEFRTVRIAFDPLWTEYFDPEVAQLVEKILGGLERFEEDLDFGELTALEALEPYLTIAEELGADLDEPVIDLMTPPDAVADLLQGVMSPTVYTALPPERRANLDYLGSRYRAVLTAIDRPSAVLWKWEHWPPTNAAKHGVYEYDGGSVNYPLSGQDMPDFWRITGLEDRIEYNDRVYVDRAKVLDDTGYDPYPGTVSTLTIYTYSGSSPPMRYVKTYEKKAMEVGTRVYVWVKHAKEQAREHFRAEAEQLLAAASLVRSGVGDEGEEQIAGPGEPDTVGSNLEALARLLGPGDYRFKIFSPGSVNFGLLLKYRQAWEPQNYQVGDLVRTIPLAPKESRKYKKHLVVKKARNQKEIENALQTKSDSEETTGRAESEITRRAQNATNFEATAEGKGGIGVVEFGGSATAKVSAQEDNAKNKRKMRQAVQKAAHEYKQERRLEISTVDSEDLETTESGEISNPNEEITVTYLFYELQKRFLVNERLVEIEPIILIAHDVPLPSQLTESWLIRHDWILKRVLLDDSFLPTFKLLGESNKARDVMIGVLRDDLRRKAQAFEEIKEQVEANMRAKDRATAALKEAVNLQIKALDAQHTTGEEAGDVALTIFTHGLFGSQGLLGIGGTAGEDFENAEAAEHRQESAEDMLARTDEEARRLRSLLEAAEVALDSATQKYSEAVRARLNKELAVLRLRNHIAQNILHYMQAIWEYEPPDQRYFRIYDIRVPIIGGDVDVDVGENDVTLTFSRDGIDMSNPEIKRLADIADLDRLVGYKGNFLMFPLREHNYLTAWMVQDYLDGSGHVRDPDADQMPDPGAGLAVVGEEIATLQAMSVELSIELTQLGEAHEAEEVRAAYKAARSVLNHKIRLEQAKIADIVVPTDLLFIEALTGSHPLLESFKLRHRALDVDKVALENEKAAAERDLLELERIRRMARLLSGDYEDPEVDKSVSVTGASPALITEI